MDGSNHTPTYTEIKIAEAIENTASAIGKFKGVFRMALQFSRPDPALALSVICCTVPYAKAGSMKIPTSEVIITAALVVLFALVLWFGVML